MSDEKKGKNGDLWEDRLSEYHSRGASPTHLHYYLKNDLPCMEDDNCPYLQGWKNVKDAPVIIGGPAHAGLRQVVENRVVIFDEDPENTYRTELDATELSNAVSQFLQEQESLPVDNYHELLVIANKEDQFKEHHETIRDELTDSKSVAKQSEATRDEGGHAEAPTAVLAMLELDGPTVEEASKGGDWDDRLRDEVGLGVANLPDGAQVVYDHAESRLIIRRPPNLKNVRAIVGLDGTPIEPLWRGRLGVDEVTIQRVLCDDCRRRYLTDVLGYTFIQTTDAVKPYSSGTYVNRCIDYGLIEAVATHHDTEPGVITTRTAENQLFDETPDEPFVDADRVNEKVANKKHYGNLRSSNEFEGTKVGIILGSPHPGDRPLQISAALEGYTAIRDENSRGVELNYGIPDRPFLRHYRENKVAQAALRFGRSIGATVYLHTGVMPDWLAAMLSHEPDDIDIDKRSKGHRSVLTALLEEGPGTASEIADRDTVTVGKKHTRDILKQLHQQGIVTRDDKQPYTWKADGAEEAPHTAHVVLPDGSYRRKN